MDRSGGGSTGPAGDVRFGSVACRKGDPAAGITDGLDLRRLRCIGPVGNMGRGKRREGDIAAGSDTCPINGTGCVGGFPDMFQRVEFCGGRLEAVACHSGRLFGCRHYDGWG